MNIVPKFKENEELEIRSSWHVQMFQSILFRKLEYLRHGFLQIICEGKVYEFGNKSLQNNLHAVIRIHNINVYREIVLGGEPAAGRTYVQGWWSSDNLIAVTRLFTKNRSVLVSFKYGFASIAKNVGRIYSRIKRNNVRGAKKNIEAHYDIGNDLYQLFLSKDMMYSSAYFTNPDQTLEDASEQKLKLICDKLRLCPKDKIIEIGSGWGGFAIFAASHYGCHVTTTTISEEQYSYTISRIKELGLENKITVLKKDYRNLTGQYDKLVSIEMIESVGEQYFREYFSTCSKLLKPNGIMLIQAITISDFLYKQYIRSVDFIRKYVFPGGSLPCISVMLDTVSSCTDLTLFHSEGFASSYANTLKIWHQKFFSQREKVIELGYPQSFIRLWEYYLKYCQAGFEERVIDVHHIVLKKPANRLSMVTLPGEQ